MSTSLEHSHEGTGWPTPPVPSTESSPGTLGWQQSRQRYGFIAATLFLLSALPALSWHVAQLLARPHYQFLVFLPAALWLLISARNERSPVVVHTRGRTMLLSLFLSVAIQLAAAFLWSPWLAAIGTWLAIPASLWLIGGTNLVRYGMPAWIFSLVLIPPPFGLDEDLIVSLRDVTTRLTSVVLDQLGVLHVSYANIIEVPGKTLFVADACSGIHSLYVLLASALLLALWNRRSLLHGLLLLVFTVAVVLIENIARLVLITVALEWHIDCTEGLPHTLLGIGLFCTSLGLVASIDQLLVFLLGEGRAPFGYLPPLEASATAGASWTVSATASLAAATPLIGLMQFANVVTHWPEHPRLIIPDMELPLLAEETLPPHLGPYTFERFERVKRVHGDPFGQASDQWTFVGDQTTVTISIDHPFETRHDLCICYENIGWSVVEKQVLSTDQLPQANGRTEAAIAIGRLRQPMNGEALLCFSHMDRNGRISAAVRGDTQLRPQQNVRRRIASLLAVDQRTEIITAEAVDPPFIQFHLFARTAEPLTPERIDSLKQFYLEARELLVDAIAAQDPSFAAVRPASPFPDSIRPK